MLVYYVPPFLIFLASFSLFKKNSNYIDILLVVSGLILGFLITAIKFDVDPDYFNYKYYYDILPNLDQPPNYSWTYVYDMSDGMERGFIFLNIILKSLSLPYESLIFVCSLLSLFLLLCLFFKFREIDSSTNSTFIFFVFYCFYYQAQWIQLRFNLAILIGYLAIFVIIFDRRYVLGFVLLFISVMFHNAGYFFIPLLIAYLFRDFLCKNYIVLLLCSCFLLFFDVSSSFELLKLDDRYDYYISGDGYSVNDSYLPFVFRISIILSYVFCYIFIFDKSKTFLSSFDSDISKLFSIMSLALVYSWALGYSIPILYRVSWVYEFGLLFVLVHSCNVDKVNRAIMYILFSLFTFYKLYVGVADLSPYKSLL